MKMAIKSSLSSLMSSHPRMMSICSSENRSSNSSALARASIAYLCIPLLHPVAATSDGEGCLAPAQAVSPLPGRVRAISRIRAGLARLDDSRLGDWIGGGLILVLLVFTVIAAGDF